MHIEHIQVDVLVIGAGLAGTQAAYCAAKQGLRVAISTRTHMFSGLSFSNHTWGMQVISPQNEDDADDLIDVVRDVGQACTKDELSSFFIRHIPHAITQLKDQGVKLVEPKDTNTAHMLPYFDRHKRTWYGIHHKYYEHALRRRMQELDILELAHTQLIDVLEANQKTVAEDVWDRRFRTSCTTDTPPTCADAADIRKQQAPYDAHPAQTAQTAQTNSSANARTITGAVLYDLQKRQFIAVETPAVVLACGGIGGIYRDSYAPHAGYGTSHAIGLAHELYLTNIEFMQLMPTFVHNNNACMVNEQTYKWARVYNAEKVALGECDTQTWHERLLQRATYGPFTSRLAGKTIDLALAGIVTDTNTPAKTPGSTRRGRSTKPTAYVKYDKLPSQLPEFAKTAFAAMQQHHLDIKGLLPVVHVAHASNGGIAIDTCAQAQTTTQAPLQGLFAAGECTGGMYGADRIGGLSSANCLVFGQIAGTRAALYAKQHMCDIQAKGQTPFETSITNTAPAHAKHYRYQHTMVINHARLALASAANAQDIARALREIMTNNALLYKNSATMIRALNELARLHALLVDSKQASDDMDAVVATITTQQQLVIAKCMLTCMLARTESRGAFWREDFQKRVASLAFPSYSWLE